MSAETLNQILKHLKSLEIEELQQLNQAVQQYLADKEENHRQTAFHQALLDAGLVKQIKHPSYAPSTERKLISVKGKPVSETIIEERR
jgi:hypothetical protein